MNREIKFRAWDKENKRFEYWGYDVLGKGIFTSPSSPLFESTQYTGLKDSKGLTEIYEGDIVVEGSEEVSSAVEWIDGQFIIYDSFFLTTDEAKDLKVIGNIYENKELLEENK